MAFPIQQQGVVRLATDDRVYCLRRPLGQRGGERGGLTLMALDAATGETVWSCTVPGRHPAFPWPVLDRNRIWILDDAGGREDGDSPGLNQLVWVDAGNGSVHPCLVPTKAEEPASGDVVGVEEVGDDLVGDSAIRPVTAGGFLVSVRATAGAYSLEDGTEARSPFRNTFPGLGFSDEVVGVGDALMTAGLDRDGLCLMATFTDPRTVEVVSEVTWSDQEWDTKRGVEALCAAPDGSCAFLTDDQGFPGGGMVTVALEPTGRVRWRAKGYVGLGIVDTGKLYCRGRRWTRNREVGTLAALSTASGEVVWEHSIPSLSVRIGVLTGDVLWMARRVVVGPADETGETPYASEVAAYSTETGKELGRTAINYYGERPVASNGALYVNCLEGEFPKRRFSIVALEHDDGAGKS